MIYFTDNLGLCINVCVLEGLFSLEWVKNLGKDQPQPVYIASEDDTNNPPQYEEVQSEGGSSKPTSKQQPRQPQIKLGNPPKYKPIGKFSVERHLFDVGGHTPLLSAACVKKGTNINNKGTHYLMQHRYMKPNVYVSICLSNFLNLFFCIH